MINTREMVDTKMMEESIVSPNQRLVGDISNGYSLLDDKELNARAIVNEAIDRVYSGALRRQVPRKVTTRTVILNSMPEIRKVIFNYPATVVLWSDGTKTVVKAGDYDIYDPEKGLAMAIAKKALGNRGNYYEEFKKWLPEFKLEVTESECDVSEESCEEKDTACDLCEHKDECDLIEITNSHDTRIHFAPNIGNRCKKKEGGPYTVKEFCELLNISKRTAYRMIERGDVKAKKNPKGAWIIFE